MKVLAVIGSPHKGNTYKIVQQVEDSMKKCDKDLDFEYLFLKDANLEMCRGCFLCVSKGEEYCPIKDSRQDIQDKMMAADGVIFSTPGYVFNVSGLMKNFLDRLSYVNHRPCFFGKHAMALVTSGGGGIPDVLKYLKMILTSMGFSSITELGVMTHPAIKITKKISDKIDNAGQTFYKCIKENKMHSPSLNHMLQFRIMRVNAVDSKEHFAADYEYYKDKKDYFIDAPINFFKNTLAKILEKLIIRMINSTSEA